MSMKSSKKYILEKKSFLGWGIQSFYLAKNNIPNSHIYLSLKPHHSLKCQHIFDSTGLIWLYWIIVFDIRYKTSWHYITIDVIISTLLLKTLYIFKCNNFQILGKSPYPSEIWLVSAFMMAQITHSYSKNINIVY